jgi:DNA-nicking Smr family endonuclease
MAKFNDLSDLKALRNTLKAQEALRIQEAKALAEQEKQRLAEANLFANAVGKVTPIANPQKVLHTPARPQPIARQHIADEQAALRESLSDEFTFETLMDTDENLSFAQVGIGSDVLSKLRRGHWVIQSQLDLHGLRRDDARDRLGEFLRTARKNGHRCVRVIHGKGNGSVGKAPVLKQKVRIWLSQKDEVLAFCQARAADGGAGALIVLLKSNTPSNT